MQATDQNPLPNLCNHCHSSMAGLESPGTALLLFYIRGSVLSPRLDKIEPLLSFIGYQYEINYNSFFFIVLNEVNLK